MSWQTYVDDHLMCDFDGHTLAAAAIIGHDGTVWAQSSTFPEEKLKALYEPGRLAPTGLLLGDTKYMVIQGVVMQGGGGITVKKSKKGLVIGIYGEPLPPGQCNMIVETLGDYLIEQGL
ncbi:hypothetical protein ACSQ67_011125 [Phaseolus vulgaris]